MSHVVYVFTIALVPSVFLVFLCYLCVELANYLSILSRDIDDILYLSLLVAFWTPSAIIVNSSKNDSEEDS